MWINTQEYLRETEKTYESYFPLIYNYVFYWTLSHEQTMAVVARVFEQMLPQCRAENDACALDVYIAAAEQMLAADEPGQPVLAAAANAAAAPERRAVLSILEQLTGKERMLVYYRYYLGNGAKDEGCAEENAVTEAFQWALPELEAVLHCS